MFYSVEKILSYGRDEIIESVGSNYNNLSLRHLRAVLVTKLIDSGSIDPGITNNHMFWELLDEDIIPLKNTSSDTSSNSYIKDLSENAILILLQTSTDIDFIQSLYSVSPYAVSLLNNEELLRSIATDMKSVLIPLPLWHEVPLNFIYNSNNSKYEQFLIWYKSNYYTKDCLNYNDSTICLSGAITAGDEHTAFVIESMLSERESVDPENPIAYKSLGNVPVEHALRIISISPDLFHKYVALKEYQHIVGKDLKEKEIDDIVEFSKENIYGYNYMGVEAMYNSIGYPDLYVSLYNYHGGSFDIFDNDTFKISNWYLPDEINSKLDIWFTNVLGSLKRTDMGEYKIVRSELWFKAMNNLILRGGGDINHYKENGIIEKMLELGVKNGVSKEKIREILDLLHERSTMREAL